MKKRILGILLVCILFAGAALVLYPSFSEYWNSFHQSRAIAGYGKRVARMDDEEYGKLLKQAHKYNAKLWDQRARYFLTASQERKDYETLLNISGNGIMGYVEIPEIDCTLPIYHGMDETVLQAGAGHMPASSLPVGGENTHCIILGHRGLPSAKLFTDLDKLREGDVFLLHVLEDTLIYQVDQINIVFPDELDDLKLEEGKDYCTLVTCTPYGINSHRLLVRGHRIFSLPEKVKGDVRTGDDTDFLFWYFAAFGAGAAILVILVLLYRRRRKRVRK